MLGVNEIGGADIIPRTATPDRVASAAVHFDMTNWSKGMLHELLVVAVDEPGAPLPYDYAQAKVAEDQVRVLGDTSELQPNASGALDSHPCRRVLSAGLQPSGTLRVWDGRPADRDAVAIRRRSIRQAGPPCRPAIRRVPGGRSARRPRGRGRPWSRRR